MKVFFDSSASQDHEEGRRLPKVVERLKKVARGDDVGHTDTAVIAEIVYAFLSRGLEDEAMRARAYIESMPILPS